MQYTYPEPADVGIQIPPHLMVDRFSSGFLHALKGGQLTEVEMMRLSFREGFRAGKLYLRDLRREMGILEFPMKAQVRIRACH